MQSKIVTFKIVNISCSVPYIQIKIVMNIFCFFPHSSFLGATRIHSVQLQSFIQHNLIYFSLSFFHGYNSAPRLTINKLKCGSEGFVDIA